MTRRTTRDLFILASTAAVFSTCSTSFAQFSVPRHAIAGGGGQSLGGTFDLTGTVGQEAAGPNSGAMTGGTFALTGGFWPGQLPRCPSDFNNDGFVTGDDFDAFVDAFVMGDIAADFNDDGFVTADDYDAYVEAFFAGC